ncbi:MAG TPA: 2-amino-4-hydroxy-6-hydroxymethyldihydropteridine diphosphokinase [Candidatus Cybelea sp.]
MHRAYVGIGSNLGDRVLNLDRALAAIAAFGRILRRSSFYQTAPWGNPAQPWFLNAVVLLQTRLEPRALLASLRVVEEELGRVRSSRWGPRAMDLDLLLYDDREIDEPDLQVPHPHMHERAFVLVPLAEIDDRFETLRDALPAAELAGVVPLERESFTPMPEERALSASAHVRALAQFLAAGEVMRVRVQRADLDIEVAAQPHRSHERSGDRTSADSSLARIDTIKADLVGVFHAGRPAPLEGDVFDADRELGYIEALGIRTSIHSMGAGRLVSVAVRDGAAVEYGQPLFLVARGK